MHYKAICKNKVSEYFNYTTIHIFGLNNVSGASKVTNIL